MTVQAYILINESTAVVESAIMWDGDTTTWTPPEGYLALPRATTPAKIWEHNADYTDWVLTPVDGESQNGFTWDGTYTITNEPKPVLPPEPPTPPTEVV